MPKRKRTDQDNMTEETFFDTNNVASSTEATGLVPAGLSEDDDGKAHNYGELYSVQPPKAPGKK